MSMIKIGDRRWVKSTNVKSIGIIQRSAGVDDNFEVFICGNFYDRQGQKCFNFNFDTMAEAMKLAEEVSNSVNSDVKASRNNNLKISLSNERFDPFHINRI